MEKGANVDTDATFVHPHSAVRYEFALFLFWRYFVALHLRCGAVPQPIHGRMGLVALLSDVVVRAGCACPDGGWRHP